MSNTSLTTAITRYNAALQRGKFVAPSTIQAAYAMSVHRGLKFAAKVAPSMADNVFPSESVKNQKAWNRSMFRQLGKNMSVAVMEKTRVNASRELSARLGENEERIGAWSEEHYQNFQNSMNQAIRNAENTGEPINLRDIATKSIEEGEIPLNKKIRNRARLIARDQTAKFNAALNRGRSMDLGSTFYLWVSAQDRRVRTAHDIYNGHYFNKEGKEVDSKGELVIGGLNTSGEQPGDAVQCRCVSQWQFAV